MDSDRKYFLIGLAVSFGLMVVGVGIFFVGQGKTGFEKEVPLTTDFSTITGLRKGSSVQLAGVEIGEVTAIDFHETTYDCDPMAEDFGREGQGRRDDCDGHLFCGPEGSCARLEAWTSEELHPGCRDHSECDLDAVCVTKPFRRRYPKVYWAGPDNVCAQFSKLHNRVRVSMSIHADKFSLITEESRAKVASNSVLGDQLVEIMRGGGAPIPPGGRVQSTPSIYEDLENVRQRLEVMTGKVDKGLGAISDVFGELNDDRVIAEIKDTIASLNEVSSDVAEAKGSIGGFFGDDMRQDLEGALATTDQAASDVDRFLVKANDRVGKIDSELQPKIDDARQTMAGMRGKLTDIRDPAGNHPAAKLLYDETGEKLAEVEGKIHDTAASARDADEGKGTLGKLVNDIDTWVEVIKFFEITGRGDGLRAATREALEQHEARQAGGD